MRSAAELHATIDEIDRLTSRLQKVELASREEITRAGRLLEEAAEAHKRFLAHLTAVTQLIAAMRDRQNASAVQLSQYAQHLEERHQQHVVLDERFAALGDTARQISVLIKDGVVPEPEPGAEPPSAAEVAAKLAPVKERLAEGAEEARALQADSREAGFVDLERQADAIRQQLRSLLNKLEHISGSPPADA